MVEVKKSKIIRKRWIRIIAPDMFRNKVVGETYVIEPSDAVGRGVNVDLMSLTGDIKKQNISVKLIGDKVTGQDIKTVISSYNMNPSSVKKFTRKGTTKVDKSFIAETADKEKVNVKVIMLTATKAQRSVLRALAKNAEEKLKKDISKLKIDNLFEEVIAHKLQSILRKALNKIYPLRVCEIRGLALQISKKEETESKIKIKEPEPEKAEEKPKEEKKKEKKTKKTKPIKAKEEETEKPKEKKKEESQSELKTSKPGELIHY